MPWIESSQFTIYIIFGIGLISTVCFGFVASLAKYHHQSSEHIYDALRLISAFITMMSLIELLGLR